MRSRFFWTAGCLVVGLSAFLIILSRADPHRPPIADPVPLARVSGRVEVDQLPVAGVQVRYIPCSEIAETRERFLNRFFVHTQEDGTFSLSTYVDGDGIPYGEYVLEFTWMEQCFSGEKDRLRGAYSDPQKTFLRITVDRNNGDMNLGTIRLKTSNAASTTTVR